MLKETAAVLPPVLLVWLGINAARVLRLNFSRVDDTHRSYWASFAFTRKLVKRDGKVLLVKDDGNEVPVSRREAFRVRKEIAMHEPQCRPGTDQVCFLANDSASFPGLRSD